MLNISLQNNVDTHVEPNKVLECSQTNPEGTMHLTFDPF